MPQDKKIPNRDYPLAPTPKIENTMFDYKNIYTGDAKSDPAVLKAKSDKRKSDSIVNEYKKKYDIEFKNAVLKVQADKKKK